MTAEQKINPGEILQVGARLRETYDFLVFAAAIDYPDRGVIELVYYLRSLSDQRELKLRTEVSRQGGEIDSVCGIWPAANWHEREIFDLFGVKFTGHPDLRRILLPEDWVGHPLLKDYTRAGVVTRPETVK